jgi:anti-sigma regulatory factor (Ser/Thr protein kinase)
MCEVPSRRITLKAEEGELAALEGWTARLATDFALPPLLAFRVDLCLTETIDNLLAYGYPHGRRGSFTVGFCCQPEEILIRVEDDGVAFDPTRYQPAPLPRSLAEAQTGGRGIRLVRHYADQIRYERRGDINHLVLAFQLGSVRTPPPTPDGARE